MTKFLAQREHMYGVIDIGSNSVRLMIHDGVKTIDKQLRVTCLGRGLAHSGRLAQDTIDVSAMAIGELIKSAKKSGCKELFLFATEAVRSAENGQDFTQHIQQLYGVTVEVISGEQEAEIGFLGGYTRGRVGILDIGGASSELVIGDNAGIKSAYSAKIGVMRLVDLAGEDREKADTVIHERVNIYDGELPCNDRYSYGGEKFDQLIGIGGTATTFAAIKLGLEEYDRERVNNSVIRLDELEEIIDRLKKMTVEERKKVRGLMPERAAVIVCGGYILAHIMKKLGKDEITISESDNLEGFLIKKLKR